MKKLKYSIFFLVLAFAGTPVCAWDVEHDELATLVGEFLPPEIKSFFTFDDFATLLAYCHFPDMTEWEPRRFRTLDDIEEVVGLLFLIILLILSKEPLRQLKQSLFR